MARAERSPEPVEGLSPELVEGPVLPAPPAPSIVEGSTIEGSVVEGRRPELVEGTITVSVRYYNILRLRVGIERETIVLAEGTPLRAALERLAERHGSPLREMLFAPNGRVASHLVVFRNRKLVPHDGRHLPLADGDELMLFPAVAGG